MNIWQKIVAGLKFTFGGFESAVDYVLKIMNGWMDEHGYADRVRTWAAKVEGVLFWLRNHEDWCPPKWTADFDRVIKAVEIVCTVAEDGELTAKEVESVRDCWMTAYAEWMKEG